MSVDGRVYLDTSALAKWYLNEAGSEAFVTWLQGVDLALVSSLTYTEMRSLLARRRRMGEIDAALEALLFAAFLDDIAAGSLSLIPVADARYQEAAHLIARYPQHPLRTLDALHLAVARHVGVDVLASADTVMIDTAESMGLAVARF